MIDLDDNAGSSKISKRKEVPSNLNNSKLKKNRVDQENNSVESFESKEKRQLLLIEIEEQKMILKERATADRKVQAEIEKMELENIIMKKQLESKD